MLDSDDEELSKFNGNAVYIISGSVARMLNKKLGCDQCKELIISSISGKDNGELARMKDNSGLLIFASEETERICQVAMKKFRFLKEKEKNTLTNVNFEPFKNSEHVNCVKQDETSI
jgi:hypothetical protein